MKKTNIFLFFAVLLIFLLPITTFANDVGLELSAPSALLMDFSSGQILYEKNAHEKKPMASVTKVMTLLLAMEEISAGRLSYDDIVTGSAHAKSYGGSTIFLDEGEQMSVRDILKGIAVASGNDAAVAIGEHIAGNESAFVEMMNKRAKELGMENTHFVNCNGLDAYDHYSSAYDIALMSRELMKHNDIFQFTTIWMDTLRNGKFTLSNTNKLIRFYDGATGLKTGSTDDALFCISATAKRDNMHLIAVVMAAPTSKQRQADASALLNYGFSKYSIKQIVDENQIFDSVKVEKGTKDSVSVVIEERCDYLSEKNSDTKIDTEIKFHKKIKAPVKCGDIAGSFIVKINDKEYKKINLICNENCDKVDFAHVFKELLEDWLC